MKAIVLAISFGAAHAMNWGTAPPRPSSPTKPGPQPSSAPAPSGPLWNFHVPGLGEATTVRPAPAAEKPREAWAPTTAAPPAVHHEATGSTPPSSVSATGRPAPSPPGSPTAEQPSSRPVEPAKVAARVTNDVPGKKHSALGESGRDSGRAPALWRVWSASDRLWWTGPNLDDLRRWVAARNSPSPPAAPAQTPAAAPNYAWPTYGWGYAAGGCSSGRCGR